jgi:hypothetical protein
MTNEIRCWHCGCILHPEGKYAQFCTCPNCLSQVRIGGNNPTAKAASAGDDPVAVKAAREEYCIDFMESQTSPLCWSCGRGWEDSFVCKACNCEFITALSDARYCPACGSTDLGAFTELLGLYKSIDDRLDEMDHEKFPDSDWKWYRKDKGRYAREKHYSQMNKNIAFFGNLNMSTIKRWIPPEKWPTMDCRSSGARLKLHFRNTASSRKLVREHSSFEKFSKYTRLLHNFDLPILAASMRFI